VTVTVAAVLATVGIPSLQSLIANTRLTTATNTLVAALATTRSEAIKRSQHVVLCPSRDRQTCSDASHWHLGYVLYVDGDDDGALDPNEAVLREFDVPSGVTVRTSVYRDHVSYQPSGLAYGSNLSFAVCVAGVDAGRAVIVSNTGRARVARVMPNGNPPCPRA
jgi:type IV fimbrial biogenesis protein FimT